jgi:hypothetical protein
MGNNIPHTTGTVKRKTGENLNERPYSEGECPRTRVTIQKGRIPNKNTPEIRWMNITAGWFISPFLDRARILFTRAVKSP